jgi:DNA-binding helix-hairpin-helix protein with protein kinase domain
VNEFAIPRSRLGVIGHELGRGGQARVYALPEMFLPDAPGLLVFKEYRNRSTPPHGLRSLVAVRNRLDTTKRDRLDALTCWPLRVVEDESAVRGVILRLIPPSFLQERVLPGTLTRKNDPREVQNLIVDPRMTRRLGMPCPTIEQRLTICRDFAAAVHFVHRLGLVIGDINPRNALYRIPDRPSIMLLDCDAIRVRGNMSVVAQLNAPDWEPPEGGRALTQATDRYKLGLFVLRCLSPGKQASISLDPTRANAALDAEGRVLMHAALSRAPEQRPTAQDWGRYLDWRITGRRASSAPSPPPRPRHDLPQTTAIRGLRRDASGVWRQVN